MDTKDVYRFSAGTRFFNFDAYSFIIDLDAHAFYNLGVSSSLMAAQIDGVNDLDCIVAEVAKRYNATETESRNAVIKFIEMLKDKKLVEVSQSY